MTWMIAAQGGSGDYPDDRRHRPFCRHPSARRLAGGRRLEADAARQSAAVRDDRYHLRRRRRDHCSRLPDLQGRAVVGAGQGPVASIALGQAIDAGPDTSVACLGLNYIVNVSGALPPGEGDGGFPPTASVLGEFIAYAGASIPSGWVTAAGAGADDRGQRSPVRADRHHLRRRRRDRFRAARPARPDGRRSRILG